MNTKKILTITLFVGIMVFGGIAYLLITRDTPSSMEQRRDENPGAVSKPVETLPVHTSAQGYAIAYPHDWYVRAASDATVFFQNYPDFVPEGGDMLAAGPQITIQIHDARGLGYESPQRYIERRLDPEFVKDAFTKEIAGVVYTGAVAQGPEGVLRAYFTPLDESLVAEILLVPGDDQQYITLLERAMLPTFQPGQFQPDQYIRFEYDGKVVYTYEALPSVIQKDCAERGGVFNECGSSCAPDAQICTKECAFTCEW
jgi:hypothetical protein